MSGFLKKLMATGVALTMGISSVASANFANNGCCPPPCDPCGDWVSNIHLNASWLYWKVGGDGNDFAVEKTFNCVEGNNIGHERVRHIDNDWDSGYRIGGGFNFPCFADWGVDLIWTSFETSKSHRSNLVGLGNSNVVFGFPSFNGFTDCLEEGDTARFCASTKFEYNTLDLEFGKWCCCGSLLFRPHIGVRFAEIEDRFRNGVELSIPFEGIDAARVFSKNRFEGAGIRAGLDVDLPFWCDFGFIGRTAISSLWGTSHVRNHTVFSSNSFIDNNFNDVRARDHRPLFIADLSLGLRWKSTLFDCYAFSLEIAYENHYLFNQHKFFVNNAFNEECEVSSNSSSRRGDILLHGLTLTAGFDF